MKIITVAAIKGGTGKTTTAAALAQAAAASGQRVLAVDLDPQANLTFALKADLQHPGSMQLLNGAAAQQVLQDTEQHITVIAGHRDLSTLKTTPGSAERLRDALKPLDNDFDICIIDTPPTLGESVYNALNAASGLIIPLETDANSIQGLYQIAEVAQFLQQHSNKGLEVLGVILTRYDSRPKINQYLHDAIQQAGAEIGAPLLTEIRAGVSVREAIAMQQSLFEYAPKSKPAQDYMRLYKMIMA